MPFVYPDAALVRRPAPSGYADHAGFKPWLRDEFAFRCVYCLEREAWYPDRADSFSADHVLPQSAHPELAGEYSNLVYACTRCNSLKGEGRVLNPARESPGSHLSVLSNGLVRALSEEGEHLVRLLHLNDEPALSVRRVYLTLARLAEDYPGDARVASLCAKAFGYPEDMPDLRAARPPGGNGAAGSEAGCYFARRERGELPETY